MSMIKRKKRENPYVVVDKTALNDVSLSWKAKGLLVYLLSLPDEWKVYLSDLNRRSRDGKDSTQSGLNELEKQGYARRILRPKKDGKFDGYDFEISETPEFNQATQGGKTAAEKPQWENRNGLSAAENPQVQSNNRVTNKKQNNKKQSNHTKIEVADKGLVKELMDFFGFNELANYDKYRETAIFLNILSNADRLTYFKEQFKAYREYKSLTGEKTHGFKSFLGQDKTNGFVDGGWNAENWVMKLSALPKNGISQENLSEEELIKMMANG